jgi:hypothetical protein
MLSFCTDTQKKDMINGTHKLDLHVEISNKRLTNDLLVKQWAWHV